MNTATNSPASPRWVIGVFLLTAALTFVCFPPVDAGEFALVFLVPAALWAYRAPPFRVFAWTIFAAQTFAWTLLMGWLHNVTWFGLFLLGPFLGLLASLWFGAAWWVLPRIRGAALVTRILSVTALAAAWVLCEWLRSWIFSGLPWLPLAASQWHRPAMLQIAAYGGAAAVSFVLVFFNLGVAALVHRLVFERERNRRSPEFLAALFVFVFSTIPFLREMFGQQRATIARVALVQPYIAQGEKWDPDRARSVLDTIEHVTSVAATDKPDAIFLPEAVVPWALYRDPNVQLWLESMTRRHGVPLLLGTVFTRPDPMVEQEWFNGAFVVDPKTGLQEPGYAKRQLVPFGEFVPFRSVLGWLEKFAPIGGDFQRGATAAPLSLPTPSERVPVGMLICYEDIFPELARDTTRAGAEVLVVLTNNGWFGEGAAAYQHAAHSVLRAVENRRPLIRVGNGGWSGWIDEYGHIRATLLGPKGNVYFRGHETVEVTRDTRWGGRLSFYTQHGAWFTAACAVLALAGWVTLRRRMPAAESAIA